MTPAEALTGVFQIGIYLVVGLVVVGLVAIIVGEITGVTRIDGTPRKVRRLAKLFDVGLPQTCITYRGRHVEALVAEAERRGFHLHDRTGDLLIFRKAQAFRVR